MAKTPPSVLRQIRKATAYRRLAAKETKAGRPFFANHYLLQAERHDRLAESERKIQK